jgi:hypothetical protein
VTSTVPPGYGRREYQRATAGMLIRGSSLIWAIVSRAAAEADGYTAAQLEEACGGDIADFIRVRFVDQGGIEHKMAGDPFPLPMGIKQE